MALDLTEAVEAAARASYEDWRESPNAQGSWRPVWEEAPTMLRVNITEALLPTVTAVAPLIEAQVREQVAQEIEAGENWTPEGPFSCAGCPVPGCNDLWESEGTCTHVAAIEWAARIARGATS